jgi:hypothetical protein
MRKTVAGGRAIRTALIMRHSDFLPKFLARLIKLLIWSGCWNQGLAQRSIRVARMIDDCRERDPEMPQWNETTRMRSGR